MGSKKQLSAFGSGFTVITGASAGIGHEFAKQLAAHGHNLFLIARRRAELQALAELLQEEHGVTVEWLVADLSTGDGVSDTKEVIKAKNVTALINNAGIGKLGPFHEQSLDNSRAQMSLNVTAMMELSHCAASQFVKQGSGLIVNLSSVAAFYPVPDFAIYSLTKAFAKDFSLSLNHELRNHGVRCVAVCPGFTKTEFFEAAGMRKNTIAEKFAMPVESCIKIALNDIEEGDGVIVTGIQNKMLAFFSRILPNFMKLAIGKSIVKKGMS